MPIEPVYPRKLLIMGIVLPFGLILGISLALLLEYVSDRIETERDINSIEGMNFLGTVRLMASE
jgi:capsular polysaccharide biosynthesis protein